MRASADQSTIPKKPAANLIRDGRGFPDKIMLALQGDA
jgi:hypothetical protein